MIPKIDFMLVGAAKSGTTSLHCYLGEHPQIFTPQAKELAFFYAPKGDTREREYMHHFYREASEGQMLGLSEASMLMFDYVPRHIIEHNPEARVVIILRNPIERAYSAYWFGRLRGWDHSPTFEEALQRELNGELKTRKERIDFAHLEHGHYQEQIECYAAVVGRERMKVLLTEELRERPRQTLVELFDWLGVSPRIDRIRIDRKHNVTSVFRFPRATNALRALSVPGRKLLLKRLSPPNIVRLQHILRPLKNMNQVPFEPPVMRSKTREFLRTYYVKCNPQLGKLIGRDISHWH